VALPEPAGHDCAVASMASPQTAVVTAGMLLTGGGSLRMGVNKATIKIDGVPAATRVMRLLSRVADPVIEVGPGLTGIQSIWEEPHNAGPLAAMVAGGRYLRKFGHSGPVLVVACDLPLVNEAVFRMLADWPGTLSVVPIVDGVCNPLCARWSIDDLALAERVVLEGFRSVRALIERCEIAFAEKRSWPPEVKDAHMTDADTPDQMDGLGISWCAG
jgi:molybdenum cofactor guanylyltransferase